MKGHKVLTETGTGTFSCFPSGVIHIISEKLVHLPEQGKAESLIQGDKESEYFQV